jgi:hypothetical protein
MNSLRLSGESAATTATLAMKRTFMGAAYDRIEGAGPIASRSCAVFPGRQTVRGVGNEADS